MSEEIFSCKKSFWDFSYQKKYYILFFILFSFLVIGVCLILFFIKRSIFEVIFICVLYSIVIVALIDSYLKARKEINKIIIKENSFRYIYKSKTNIQFEERFTNIEKIYKTIINISRLNGFYIFLNNNEILFVSTKISNYDKLINKLIASCKENDNELKITYKIY